jgi:hypothetical protein
MFETAFLTDELRRSPERRLRTDDVSAPPFEGVPQMSKHEEDTR